MIKKQYLFVFALALFSCNQRKESEANTDLLYFDVKGYFKKEISRLQKQKPIVNKMVIVNGASENKALVIQDWNKELSVFIDADINKTSWKGSFQTSKNNLEENYTSSNKKIPVKSIRVEKDGARIKKVEIFIANKNILYTSNDTLVYYPDSLYQIKKQQKIKLLEPKKYIITGKIR
ncbi:hypothetical protein DHW03_18595 [Pedobacter yonginense]|uniref:Uncharacterized protein n=1 Tax=Pedobacter yonginense TaxID=651869 RepID=A0A317EL95_9SPHI|nr:hypothetical protein [Pedobacter yonginense]PWS26056.1 hypothetical protein DHW03_18595 [Pedobacter yonginense]